LIVCKLENPLSYISRGELISVVLGMILTLADRTLSVLNTRG